MVANCYFARLADGSPISRPAFLTAGKARYSLLFLIMSLVFYASDEGDVISGGGVKRGTVKIWNLEVSDK